MGIGKLCMAAVSVLIMSSCNGQIGKKQQVSGGIDDTSEPLPPMEISVYHVYNASECMEWFSSPIINLRKYGNDSLKVVTAHYPGLLTAVPEAAKEDIDKEFAEAELPDSVDWAWIRYWNRSDSLAPLWDLLVYDRTPLLTDTVVPHEDNNIDGFPQLAWRFNDPCRFAEITRNHINRSLALSINGRIIMAPTVNNEIESGNCAVGAITREELMDYLEEQ